MQAKINIRYFDYLFDRPLASDQMSGSPDPREDKSALVITPNPCFQKWKDIGRDRELQRFQVFGVHHGEKPVFNIHMGFFQAKPLLFSKTTEQEQEKVFPR